jgi:hypothetical protein
MNAFTLAQVPRAITRVPWWDEWAMIQEYADVLHGHALWPILWSAYWGHRMVVGRLIFFADARWAGLASIDWLLLSIQFAHIALMILLAWLLIGRRSRACFVLACAVILNLMLAGDQMENLVWRNELLYVLVFALGTAAFVLLAAASRSGNRLFALLALVTAVLATVTMGNGFLVWPVLLAEAIYLRFARRVVIAMGALGAAVVGAFLWHYQIHQNDGMQVIGMLRHPFDAAHMLGLYLAGPLDFFSMNWGAAIAIAALLMAVFLSFVALREREQPWIAALVAVLLFIVLTSASVVAGRLSPQWIDKLHDVFPLPSRYFTPIYTFWTAVALLVLITCWISRRRLMFLLPFGALFAVLLFGRIVPELGQAEDWADFFRASDAIGSAMILEVPDEQLLSAYWPNPAERNQIIAFMRQQRISMFAEARASWPGRPIADVFRTTSPDRCQGGVEAATPVPSQGFRSWRLEGWAWGDGSPADIVIADDSGRIVGSGRGQLRHGYYPGLNLRTALPPPSAIHAAHRHSEWLAYARVDDPNASGKLQVYARLGDGEVCAIGATP